MSGLAVLPLTGNAYTEEDRWLGAAMAHLLARYLTAAGLTIIDPNTAARHLIRSRTPLPLEPDEVNTIRTALKADAVLYGTYSLDEGQTLGLTLRIHGPDLPRTPLEAAAPPSTFHTFFQRITLALAERMRAPITAETRARVAGIITTENFDAFRQLARARLAWSRGENELALAAVEAALMLDVAYEEAVGVRIAIARDAKDTVSTQEAFKQWIALARQRGEAGLAAERTILFGHWLVERQLWDEARGAYREAADIYRREKDVVGEARARNNLANLDVLAGSAQAAIASYRRTLRTLHDAEADTRTDMALAYFNLSLAHKQLGQQEEAIRALEEAMRLAVDLNDRQHQARIIAQRGTLRDDMGQWAEAMADYARATNLFDTLGDTLSKAVVRAHQALLYRRQGMYDRAAAILQESAAVFESADTPSPFDQAVLWLNLADLAFAMDNVDRAWELATQAQPIFEALKSHLASRTAALLAAMEDLPDDSH